MNIKFAPQVVRAQLQRILADGVFVRCRRMQRFLEFIVEETLAGRAEQLGEYAIGLSVFDRGPDFEPALDPIVRIDARRLRQKLLEYYCQHQPADELVIDIPKGAYVPVFLRLPSLGQRSNPRGDHPPRVAVLPFEVLSDVPEDAMCGRALCMSLTANLTGLHGLETIAHSFLPEIAPREAVSKLRLSHAIHGSVMQTGSRYRITVHLICMKDETQLWAREYDFEGKDLLAFQSAITRSVRQEVVERLGVRVSQPVSLAIAA